MFEKEAEEIMMQKVIKENDCIMTPCKTLEDCQFCDFCFDDMVDAFKDGAEFGYNKAKEEMQKNGLALQSDMDKTIEQNIALKKQIEKLEKLVPKTCENCVGYGCHAICVDCDFKDKWEIK